MVMDTSYPFSMLFTGYSDKKLITEALGPLTHYDRADLLSLIGELANRFADVLDESYENTQDE